MTKPIPTVQRYMSTTPHSIGRHHTLAQAHRTMREHRIRHLPVLEDGVLVGLLSQGDLHLIETLRDVDPNEVTVEAAMSSDVYAVAPDAGLDDVASTLAHRKLSSAVVMQNQRVVGVFTTVDACNALSELLRGRLTH